MKKNILAIDDEPKEFEKLELLFNQTEVSVTGVTNPTGGISLIHKEPDKFKVVILDYNLPEMTGDEIARKIKSINPNINIVVYSGDSSRSSLKNSFKAGVEDFFEKSTADYQLKETVLNIFKRIKLEAQMAENQLSPDECKNLIQQIGMVGQSNQLATVASQVLNYRENPYTVMIIGETGTGKEKIAQALHKGSANKFIAINCGAYKERVELMASELFGHEQGAFTGATSAKLGAFREANGGTLFLDEIHQLCPQGQTKLLRALQENKVRPVGSSQERPFTARVVVAAKPEVFDMKQDGRFLVDLFNRLYVFPVHLAPLRERKEDISELAHYFVEKYSRELSKNMDLLFSTLKILENHKWPGNVRELENTILRVIANAKQNKITPAMIMESLNAGLSIKKESVSSLKESLEQLEVEKIVQALEVSNSIILKAAQLLGIPESTLRSKIKKYGLGRTPKEAPLQGVENAR